MGHYTIDEAGDIVEPDPLNFGWTSTRASQYASDDRRDLRSLAELPGISVRETEYVRLAVGAKRGRHAWMEWKPGHAPPAAVMSKHGMEHPDGSVVGTRAYVDRLTDAFGIIARNLPARPERSPMIAYDFVQGRRFEVTFTAVRNPVGTGNVYVVAASSAIKIGYTDGEIASRIRDLQTGNPDHLIWLARVSGVTVHSESHLHTHFKKAGHHIRREWFDRRALELLARDAGGLDVLIRDVLGTGDYMIEVNPDALERE